MRRRAYFSIGIASIAPLLMASPHGIAVQAGARSPALPPEFAGRITYQGSHSGTVDTAARPMRRGGVMGGRSRDVSGAVTFEVTYSGPTVSATYSVDGRPGRMSGTRSGDRCEMVNQPDRATGSFLCTASQFSGTLRSPPARRSYTAEIQTRATSITAANAASRQVAAEVGVVTGSAPTGLRDFYSGKLRCSQGERTVRLRVLADGRGKISMFPPSYGADFEVRLIQDREGLIHVSPAGRVETTSYEARRHGLFTFGATLKWQSDGALNGVTSNGDCGRIALIPHGSSVTLSPGDFNRLSDMLGEYLLLREPDLSQDCGGGLFVSPAVECP